jgi:hypothetical protein
MAWNNSFATMGREIRQREIILPKSPLAEFRLKNLIPWKITNFLLRFGLA